MIPIWLYLDGGKLPTSNLEGKKVGAISASYILVDGILYWRGYSLPLLRCMDIEKGNYLLQEIHKGICRAHEGSRSITHKALC